MSSPKFAKTHNVVAFLEKHVESDGFAEIIDFLKASFVHYALTVNPIIYTSCIEQFWATTKVQTVNGVCQLQAIVDKKRVIITESSIRCDLHLEDAGGTDCLPTTTIFEELARKGLLKAKKAKEAELTEVVEVSSDEGFFGDEDLVLYNDVKYPLSDAEIRIFKERPTTSRATTASTSTRSRAPTTSTRSRALIGSTSNAQAAFTAPRGYMKIAMT
ncbi:hypothetical protein Tco_0487924 [Tanacetum coccineum]